LPAPKIVFDQLRLGAQLKFRSTLMFLRDCGRQDTHPVSNCLRDRVNGQCICVPSNTPTQGKRRRAAVPSCFRSEPEKTEDGYREAGGGEGAAPV
jgi:hypothetical protein